MMEVHTSRYIVEQLKRMGITDVHEGIGNTGVVQRFTKWRRAQLL